MKILSSLSCSYPHEKIKRVQEKIEENIQLSNTDKSEFEDVLSGLKKKFVTATKNDKEKNIITYKGYIGEVLNESSIH